MLIENQMTRGPTIVSGDCSGTLTRYGDPILAYSLNYPIIIGAKPSWRKMNLYYQGQLGAARRQIEGPWKMSAEQQYEYLRLWGSFSSFVVSSAFSVMYNDKGITSIFRDQYLNFGVLGHRLQRTAHTWDNARAVILPLSAFFKPGCPWPRIILSHVRAQLNESNEPGAFYADWPQTVSKLIDYRNYYLADDGVVLYFPEQKIAPQNTGIPSFLIPYSSFGGGLNTPL